MAKWAKSTENATETECIFHLLLLPLFGFSDFFLLLSFASSVIYLIGVVILFDHKISQSLYLGGLIRSPCLHRTLQRFSASPMARLMNLSILCVARLPLCYDRC